MTSLAAIVTELDQRAEQHAKEHAQRKARTAKLRVELAAARAAGKMARHAQRLRCEAITAAALGRLPGKERMNS
jgi:hypothetical protein